MTKNDEVVPLHAIPTLADIINMVPDATLRGDLWCRQQERDRQRITSYADIFQLSADLLILARNVPLEDAAVTKRLKVMNDTAKLSMDAWKSYLDTEHVTVMQKNLDKITADHQALRGILQKRLDKDLLEEIDEEWRRVRQD